MPVLALMETVLHKRSEHRQAGHSSVQENMAQIEIEKSSASAVTSFQWIKSLALKGSNLLHRPVGQVGLECV